MWLRLYGGLGSCRRCAEHSNTPLQVFRTGRSIDVDWTYSSVVGWAVVLCKVVGEVGFAWGPIDIELVLFDTVAQPVKSHVDCFGLVLFDSAISDTVSGAVVSSDWSGWLRMAEFAEGDAERDSCPCIHEEGGDFGFGGGGHDASDEFGKNSDGAVDELAVLVTKPEEAPCAAAGSACDQVGSVTVTVENHVAGAIEFGGILVGRAVVE